VGVAYFLAHLGEYFDNEPAKAFVQHNAAVKCSFAFWVAFLRGVGANMLVCLGSWQALSTDDTLAKIFSMWWPAFTFTAISFEHCIANMYLIPAGLFAQGASFFSMLDMFSNIVPVTLGNIVGGVGILILHPNRIRQLVQLTRTGPCGGGRRSSGGRSPAVCLCLQVAADEPEPFGGWHRQRCLDCRRQSGL
jgi:formate/nitrite transporter FocA (FNT family)